MTKQELIRRSLEALAEFRRLPPEEQFRQLIERGLIDENGQALFGNEKAEREKQRKQQNAADSPPPNGR